jgi:PDZ domain
MSSAAVAQLDQPAIPVPPELRQRNRVGVNEGNLSVKAEDLSPRLPSSEELLARPRSPLADELVRDLGAAEYATRRAATERLLGSDVPLEDLLAMLARGGLSPEQHHRLLSIAFDRIVNAPRGALGVQMNLARGGEPGVRVTRVIAGFPAEKHIQVDDLIVAIDGRAVRDPDDLRMIVQGHPPGIEVRVEAIRAERDARGKIKLDDAGNPLTRRIDVRVPLGSKRELDNAEPLQGGPRGFGRDPLDTARQEEGRALVRRFPPPTVNTRLPDDAKVDAEFATRDVDRHELVETLLLEIADARLSQRPLAPQKVGYTKSQLRAIRQRSEDPTHSDAERAWLRRVADRLDELLRDAVETDPN